MATIQMKAKKSSDRNNSNKNSVTRRKKKSSRRRSEITALGLRAERSSSSSEDDGEPTRTLLATTLGDTRSGTSGSREKSSVSGSRNLNSNLNETLRPADRRISRRDIIALLDEQRSFREELEDISKSNFNLEHLLSNCALKVENFNRKLLLVEYELSDFHSSDLSNPDRSEMKWKESKERGEERVSAEKEDDLPQNVPLRRTSRSTASPSSSPPFDHGRHKLEKYAKIHGIVDVEIEMYSSADDFETTTDNRDTTDLEEPRANSDSENTFSYGDKEDTNKRNGDVHEKTSDVVKEIMTPVSKPFRFSTRDELIGESKDPFKIDPNLLSDHHDNSSEQSKTDSAHRQPTSAAEIVEYSLVDADNDIFSQSIHSNDTIEQIDIVFPAEDLPPCSMAKTSSTVDSTTVLDTKQDHLDWPDIGTTLLGDEDGLGGSWVDDVLRQYDRESSRERESLSETALSNGFDYRLETMSSSSFFSEDDDRTRAKKRPNKNNSYSPQISRESPDYDSVFTPDLKRSSPVKFDLSLESEKASLEKPSLYPFSARFSATQDSTANSRASSADNIRISEPNSRRSSVDKLADTNSRRPSVDKNISTPGSVRSSLDKNISSPRSTTERRAGTPDSGRSTPDRQSYTPDPKRATPDIRTCTPDAIPEETTADLAEDDAVVENGKVEVKEKDEFLDLLQVIEEFGESEEDKLRRKESEAVDKLLADLEITDEDIQKAYNTPAIKIETGVEDGALTLRGHKNEIEPEADPRRETESPITEDRSETHSVFGLEDSDEERRRRWRERPFAKRGARSFFARLCACWHH